MAGFLAGAAGGAAVTIVIQAVDKFTNVFAGVNKGMLVIGAGITALGIAGLAASKGFINTAASFETAFTGVKKTVELSEAEFEKLRQTFKDLTKEIPITFEELSSIGEIAGQLGVEGVDNIAKFTKTIADISVTTNLTAEEAATAFARIANVMNEPIENVDRMGSAIVDLGNNFATSEQEIVTMSMRIMGAGKTIGLTTQEVFGMSAALSALGIKSEMGGSAISRAMITIAKAVAGGGEAMVDNTVLIEEHESGLKDLENQLALAALKQSEFTETTKESTRVSSQMKIEEITEKIKMQKDAIVELEDAHGSMIEVGSAELKKFAEVAGMTMEEFTIAWKEKPIEAMSKVIMGLKGITESGGDTFGVLEDLDLKSIRITDTMLRLSGSQDGVTEAVKSSVEAWEENTALVEEAEKRYGTTDSQVTILKNKFAALKDDMGRTLIPAFISLVDILGKVIGWFEKHPTLTKFAVAALAIGSALMVVLGPILMLVAIIPALVAGIGLIGAAFTVAALPIIAIVALVVGIIAAIVLLGKTIAELWRRWKGESAQSKEEAIDEFNRMNKKGEYAEAKMDEEVFKSESGKSYVKDVDEKGVTRYEEVKESTTKKDEPKIKFTGGKGVTIGEDKIAKIGYNNTDYTNLNDFILTPSGKIIKTNPQDTIIGTKTPEKMGGGVTIILNGDIYGVDPDDMAEAFADKLNKQIRM